MIINTEKIDEKELKAIGTLLYYNFTIDNNSCFNHNSNSAIFDINIYSIYNKEEEQLYVKFNDCGTDFKLNGKKMVLKNTDNLPNRCERLFLTNFVIEKFTKVCEAEHYTLDRLCLEKIENKFPKRVKSFIVSNNLLENFDNFPEEIDYFDISDNLFTSLENSPKVNSDYIIFNSKLLTSLKGINGDFECLAINNTSVTKLEGITKSLKELRLSYNSKLSDLSELKNCPNLETLNITGCPNINYYDIFDSGIDIVDVVGCDSNNFEVSKAVYEKGQTLEEFEDDIIKKLIEINNESEMFFPFKLKESKNKYSNYFKSKNGVKKFNL